jgi:hypothetical protein
LPLDRVIPRGPRHIAEMLPVAVVHVQHDPLLDLADDVHYLPSTARKAIALGMTPAWRIYELLKHFDRLKLAGTGKFVLTDEMLKALAAAAGIQPIYVKRIIRHQGQGIFWRVTITHQWRAEDIIYVELTSRSRVDALLSERAAAHLDDWGRPAPIYDAHRISKRKALLRVEDFSDLQSLEALCFAGWLSTLTDRYFTGRWVDLQSAWGRDRHTLRDWCSAAGVKIVHNHGYIDVNDVDPETLYEIALSLAANNSAWREGTRLKYWRANSFVAPEQARTGKRGICRKAAAYIRRGGDARQVIRTNHELPQRTAERYQRIKRRIRKAPHRDHYIHEFCYNKGRFAKRPTDLWTLAHLAGVPT